MNRLNGELFWCDFTLSLPTALMKTAILDLKFAMCIMTALMSTVLLCKNRGSHRFPDTTIKIYQLRTRCSEKKTQKCMARG